MRQQLAPRRIEAVALRAAGEEVLEPRGVEVDVLLDGEGVRRRVGAVAEDRPKVHVEELRHGQLDARALSLERVERAQRLLGREVEPRISPE